MLNRTFLRPLLKGGALSAGLLALASQASADDIKLRMASGHPGVNTYVNLI